MLPEPELAALPLGRRLALRTGFLLSRAWLLWCLAAVFAARDLLLTVAERSRPDTGTFWSGGHALLTAPASLYAASSAWLGAHHVNPLPGGLEGFISPPPVAFLFAPLAELPKNVGVGLWTGLDLLLLLAALLVFDRALGLAGSPRALYWLVAAFFPPTFAELDAGQVGGLLLLLSTSSLALLRRRPLAAGGLAGAAAALKFYPAVLALAAPAGRRLRYWAGLAAAAVALLVLSFLPLGLGQIRLYFADVLWPTLTPGNQDCALVSTPTLLDRYLGGARWAVPRASGVTWEQLPWGSPGAARVLTPVVALLLLGLAIWALRRAGGAVLFGGALALSLGALIPGTVFPYQMLAVLPLVLVLAVAAFRRRDLALGLWLLACLALYLRAPCDTPVANLWTAGALGVFALACYQAPSFRSDAVP